MPVYFASALRPNKPKRNAVSIVGSASNTLALDARGRLWSWGDNANGALGDNSTTSRITPVSVAGATKTFCQIFGGGSGNRGFFAIDKYNRLWGWGINTSGTIGDNTTVDKCTPVSVSGAIKTFCKVVQSSTHTLGIDKNGRLWAWGSNAYGQLGDNTLVSKTTPISVLGTVKTFCHVGASSSGFSNAIDKNGQVWSWGINSTGYLGDNTSVSRLTPVSIAGATKTFCQICTAGVYTIAIDKNGQAWGWGRNAFSQNRGFLGDNTFSTRLTPVSVVGTTKTFCKIAATGVATVAIDKNGQAWAWGANFIYYQLGVNMENSLSALTPKSITGRKKTFCHISGDGRSFNAIDKYGGVWAWGTFDFPGRVISKNSPVSVIGNRKTFCTISSGDLFSLGIDKNGQLWSWGSNVNGQLAIGESLRARYTPVSISGAKKTFCKIVAGIYHAMAIDKNGTSWGWARGQHGTLGNNSGSLTDYYTPVSVVGATKTFCHISAGAYHSVAIDKNGRAWAWGYNNAGQLGDNTIVSQLTPVSIVGATKTFCQIFGGAFYNIALDKNGRAWGWGENNYGQLGDNTITSRLTPVSVAGSIKTFCKIVTGFSNTYNVDSAFSLAIDKNGRLWAWGSNVYGQLGDNSITSRLTPVSVAGNIKTFCEISAGNIGYSVAIDKNGRAWAWGRNISGQLGDGSTTNYCTPISVTGTIKTFCKIRAGTNHTTAIDKNGLIWSWGDNVSGVLGAQIDTYTPIRICNI